MGRAPCCDERLALKKGPWTPDEDHKLVVYIQENGHGNWRALPEKAGLARCGKSCRLRWTNYLRPDIKRGRFSFDEDQTIVQLHAILGNRWSAIASHLPRRTDNEIKNYWNTHLKKRLTQLGIDPVTHKTSVSGLALAPQWTPLVSTRLTHMTQWEMALAEAEARLARSNNPPPLLHGATPAPHPSAFFMGSWKTKAVDSLPAPRPLASKHSWDAAALGLLLQQRHPGAPSPGPQFPGPFSKLLTNHATEPSFPKLHSNSTALEMLLQYDGLLQAPFPTLQELSHAPAVLKNQGAGAVPSSRLQDALRDAFACEGGADSAEAASDLGDDVSMFGNLPARGCSAQGLSFDYDTKVFGSSAGVALDNHFSPTTILQGPDSHSSESGSSNCSAGPAGASSDCLAFLRHSTDHCSSSSSFPCIAGGSDDIPENFWQAALQNDGAAVADSSSELMVSLNYLY